MLHITIGDLYAEIGGLKYNKYSDVSIGIQNFEFSSDEKLKNIPDKTIEVLWLEITDDQTPSNSVFVRLTSNEARRIAFELGRIADNFDSSK